MWCCSRCTGYRPILDAFKVFAKADPAAYTEESIAASKGLHQTGHATEGRSANKQNGHANGHSANSDAASTNGHAMNGEADSSHAASGQKQPAENGQCHGHDDISTQGTVKKLIRASNSNGNKVLNSCRRAV